MTMKTIQVAWVLAVLVPAAVFAADKAPAKTPEQRVELSVTEHGFEPGQVKVQRARPVALVVTRKTDATCATSLVVDASDVKEGKEIKADLPLGKPVEVRFTPAHDGQIRYGCAMGKMAGGVLVVE